MRLVAEGAVDQSRLQAVDQGGEEYDDPHADRHAGEDQEGLHASLTEVAESDKPGKGHRESYDADRWEIGRTR